MRCWMRQRKPLLKIWAALLWKNFTTLSLDRLVTNCKISFKKKTCLFVCFCENIHIFEKTESIWRLSIHIQPVVTMRFLPVPCGIVSLEHAFIIAKVQEYKAPASFSGQRKSSKFLPCTLSPLFWKKGVEKLIQMPKEHLKMLRCQPTRLQNSWFLHGGRERGNGRHETWLKLRKTWHVILDSRLLILHLAAWEKTF